MWCNWPPARTTVRLLHRTVKRRHPLWGIRSVIVWSRKSPAVVALLGSAQTPEDEDLSDESMQAALRHVDSTVVPAGNHGPVRFVQARVSPACVQHHVFLQR